MSCFVGGNMCTGECFRLELEPQNQICGFKLICYHFSSNENAISLSEDREYRAYSWMTIKSRLVTAIDFISV